MLPRSLDSRSRTASALKSHSRMATLYFASWTGDRGRLSIGSPRRSPFAGRRARPWKLLATTWPTRWRNLRGYSMRFVARVTRRQKRSLTTCCVSTLRRCSKWSAAEWPNRQRFQPKVPRGELKISLRMWCSDREKPLLGPPIGTTGTGGGARQGFFSDFWGGVSWRTSAEEPPCRHVQRVFALVHC